MKIQKFCFNSAIPTIAVLRFETSVIEILFSTKSEKTKTFTAAEINMSHLGSLG